MNTSPGSSPGSQTFDAVEIVVATENPGKLAEIRQLLGERFSIQSARDVGAEMPEETGATFAENAMLKASSIAEQTGKIAIADDSGLEVYALEGSPGVHTARYAGPHATDAENRAKLLNALHGKIGVDRRARFVSVIAIAFSPDNIVTTEGVCDGVISAGECGDGGFGYDCIFELPDGQTMAEISLSDKNKISHRGVAMRAASEMLTRRVGRSLWGGDS